MSLLGTAVVAFLITATLVLTLRPLADVLGLVDRPGGHKTHSGFIPVVGGIAMFGGVLMAAGITDSLRHHGVVVLMASGLMVFVGALDDRFNLKPQFRLFAHAAAAIALAYGTGFVVTSLGNLVGLGPIDLGFLALPFTIVACIALINAFNMLDGLDGLAGGCALVSFAGLAIIAMAAGATTAAVMALSLMGACLGFLVFNLPARFNRNVLTFMGDAGSTLLGFVLASVALILVQPAPGAVPPILILWMMPIPIFELFTSTARRLVRGLSPMQADNGHFHHAFIEAGFSVRVVFTIYLSLSAASVCVGFVAMQAGVPEPVMFMLFMLFFACWLLLVQAAPTLRRYLPRSLRRDLENLVP